MDGWRILGNKECHDLCLSLVFIGNVFKKIILGSENKDAV
jgi:hypothetical protein